MRENHGRHIPSRLYNSGFTDGRKAAIITERHAFTTDVGE